MRNQMKKPASGKKRGRPRKIPTVSVLNNKTQKIITGDSFHACKYMEQLYPYIDEFSAASFIAFFTDDGQLQLRVSPSFQKAQYTFAFAKALTDFCNALNMSIDNSAVGEEEEPPEDWMNSAE